MGAKAQLGDAIGSHALAREDRMSATLEVVDGWLVRGALRGESDDPTPAELIRDVAAMVETATVRSVLLDLRFRASVPSPHEARDLVRLITTFTRLRRCSIAVVAVRPALYGMVRLIGTVAEMEGVRLEAFNAVEDAFAWLESGRSGGSEAERG